MSEDAPKYTINTDRGRDILAIKLDRLAKRLGVEPHDLKPGGEPTWVIKFGENAYDGFFLIGAMLDLLEDAEQRISEMPNYDELLSRIKELERRLDSVSPDDT